MREERKMRMAGEALRGSALVRETMRREIVEGRLAPGGVLPSHLALVQRFGVSNVTVQQGLSQLATQGFLEVRPREGSFVVEAPPHLSQYGLVIGFDPDAPLGHLNWSRYFQALVLAAGQFERDTGLRMLQFRGVDWHTDTPDRQRLIEHMETHQLAGVIFANIPLYLEDSPILELPGIPRVAFETRSQHPNVRSVTFDGRQWLEKALDALASAGRRRVAVIEYDMDAEYHGWLQEGLAARGMVSLPCWTQFGSVQKPKAARHAAELLMRDRERPDAMLITDDNFVEDALAGLVAAEVRVPEDVMVVGHANFPLPPKKRLPIRLLGQDLGAALRAAVDLIDRERRGGTAADLVMIPAQWEEEVAGRVGKTEDTEDIRP